MSIPFPRLAAALAALFVLALGACLGPEAAPAAQTTSAGAAGNAAPPAPAGTLTPLPIPTEPADHADIRRLLDLLAGLGAEAAPAGAAAEGIMAVPGVRLEVDGAAVDVYAFDSPTTAAAAAAHFSFDGRANGSRRLTFEATPHLYRAGALLVVYAGDDALLLRRLAAATEDQFAGGVTRAAAGVRPFSAEACQPPEGAGPEAEWVFAGRAPRACAGWEDGFADERGFTVVLEYLPAGERFVYQIGPDSIGVFFLEDDAPPTEAADCGGREHALVEVYALRAGQATWLGEARADCA
jgi:hypothetical protein